MNRNQIKHNQPICLGLVIIQGCGCGSGGNRAVKYKLYMYVCGKYFSHSWSFVDFMQIPL